MRYIFISVLFSLGVRRVCVCCGYEDRIHFGRILEVLSGLDKDRIDYLVDFYSKSNRLSISIFTVIVIDIVAPP